MPVQFDPPSGTRDFLAPELEAREAAFAIVREIFARYAKAFAQSVALNDARTTQIAAMRDEGAKAVSTTNEILTAWAKAYDMNKVILSSTSATSLQSMLTGNDKNERPPGDEDFVKRNRQRPRDINFYFHDNTV